jgi:Rho-type GTPase-activating protein 1/2
MCADSEFGPVATPSPMKRASSSYSSGERGLHIPSPQQSQFSLSMSSLPQTNGATGLMYGTPRSGTPQSGRPATPSRHPDPASGADHMRNPSIPTNNLGVPSNGMQQALQKRRSFDDRPLNVLVREQNGSLEATSGSPGALLSPEVPTSRKAKRQSINPALVMSFTNLPQRPPSAGGSPSSPSTPQAQQQQHNLNGHPRSPLRKQFSGSDVRMSPKTFTHADNKHSPTVPRMQLDMPDSSSLHNRQYTGRSRSASSSNTYPPSHLGGTDIRLQDRLKSPGRMSITFDRVPVRVSSCNELRSDMAPPSFMPECNDSRRS